MTVTLRRADPLKECGNREELEAQLKRLQDPELSFIGFRDTVGWLKGACIVLRKRPKTERAAAHILKTVRAAQWGGGEKPTSKLEEQT